MGVPYMGVGWLAMKVKIRITAIQKKSSDAKDLPKQPWL